MLKNKNIHTEKLKGVAGINEGDNSSTEEMLRIRRELVNVAIEAVGNDPVKIEKYLSRKNVA